jgi:hypothetical protein
VNVPKVRKQAETTPIHLFLWPATGSDAMLAAAKRSEVDMDQTATAPIRFSCLHPVVAHSAAAAQAPEAKDHFRI